jgi:hypothetical protein
MRRRIHVSYELERKFPTEIIRREHRDQKEIRKRYDSDNKSAIVSSIFTRPSTNPCDNTEIRGH